MDGWVVQTGEGRGGSVALVAVFLSLFRHRQAQNLFPKSFCLSVAPFLETGSSLFHSHPELTIISLNRLIRKLRF